MCRSVNDLTARGPERLDGREGLPTEVIFRLTAERQGGSRQPDRERGMGKESSRQRKECVAEELTKVRRGWTERVKGGGRRVPWEHGRRGT